MAIRPVGPGSLEGEGLAALLREMRAAIIELQAPTKASPLAPVLEAALPPADENPGTQLYVSDLGKVALSNGTTWTDPTGGAL